MFGWGQHGLLVESAADLVWFELALRRESVRNQPGPSQGRVCFVPRAISSRVGRQGPSLG